MANENIVYDPTDIQIDSIETISFDIFDIEELSNPHVVKMLLYQHFLNLHQLKATKKELSEKHIEINQLKKELESLRIKLAGLNQNVGVDMASIFISFLGGFAINLLTTDWSNGLGWVIFSLCLAILFFFKYPLISTSIQRKMNSGE